MTRKGRKFEIIYQKLFDQLDKNKYQIESPGYLVDRITNRKREVDVLVRFTDATNVKRIISIECRDRPSTIQDVMWIEQLVTKKNDLGIDIIIATTTSSFTKSAIIKALSYGIILEQAEKIDEIFFQKLSSIQYSILSFIYLKALNLEIKDKYGKIYKSKFLKTTTNVAEKMKIENFIHNELMSSENFTNLVRSLCKTTDNGIDLTTNEFTVKMVPNNSINLIKNIFISEFILGCYINSINFKIPLINGVFIDDPISPNSKGYNKLYSSEELEVDETKYFDYLTINLKGIKTINRYLRIFQYLGAPFMRNINIESSTKFKLFINGLEDNYFGRIDFEKFWHKK